MKIIYSRNRIVRIETARRETLTFDRDNPQYNLLSSVINCWSYTSTIYTRDNVHIFDALEIPKRQEIGTYVNLAMFSLIIIIITIVSTYSAEPLVLDYFRFLRKNKTLEF